MSFDRSYGAFMEHHLKNSKGERLRRLKEGHGHAEKLFLEQVWWPAFGHLDHLHPEYEVNDFKDGVRYLDFAYLRPPLRACFEIDGFGPHWRDITRWQFADHLQRQNHLMIDGWTVIRFSFDEINEKPRRCQQVIQQWLGRWLGEHDNLSNDVTCFEKEIIRLAIKHNIPLTSTDVCDHLKISRKFAYKLLNGLFAKQLLLPVSGTQRIHSYRLNEEKVRLFY